MKKKIIFIIIYLGLILLGTKVYGANGKTINETTRIRKEASTDSDVVALVSIGTDIEIISEEGEWYKVKYSTYSGYMRKDMLKVEEDSKNENEIKIATTTENTLDNTQTEISSNEVSNSIQKGAIRKNIN